MPVRSVLWAKVASRKQKPLADGGRDGTTGAALAFCDTVDDLRAAQRSRILVRCTHHSHRCTYELLRYNAVELESTDEP